MKKFLLIFPLFLCVQVFSQIENTVITIDLSKPYLGNVKIENGSDTIVSDAKIDQLEFNYKNTLSFQFVNGNPLKYKYVINNKQVSLFDNQDNPLDLKNLVNSSSNNQKDGMAYSIKRDADLDGVADDEDKCPTEAGLKSNGGCHVDENTTYKEYFNTRLNDFLLELSFLDKEIKDYLKFTKNTGSIKNEEYKESKKIFSDKYIAIQKNRAILKDDLRGFKELSGKFNAVKKLIQINSDDIVTAIASMKSISTFTYSLPIDTNGKNIDYVEIILERHNLKTNTLVDTYPYKVWVKGGIKIEVSGGIFFTTLKDDQFYITEDTANPGNKFINKRDNGALDFGFGSLVNIKFRNNNYIAPMLSFGALFTTNQKFQFLAGGGASFGKDQRVILNAGISMGEVSRIEGDFALDNTTTSYDLGDSNAIPSNESFAIGYFFGLTYNLSKSK
jgi:hypothetical protein